MRQLLIYYFLINPRIVCVFTSTNMRLNYNGITLLYVHISARVHDTF